MENFLNSICPFRVLDKAVMWGEFIELCFSGMAGLTLFFCFYIAMILFAEIAGGL